MVMFEGSPSPTGIMFGKSFFGTNERSVGKLNISQGYKLVLDSPRVRLQKHV